jgi:DNA-binding SARP family transcriptional activator
MQFRILGPLQAISDNQSVALGSPKQRLFLAVLLMDAGKVVPTSTLIDRVWHEGAPARAQASVYAYVTRLRSLLAAGPQPIPIARAAGGYQLDVDPGTVDAHRFVALATAGRAATDDADRVALLSEALTLWHGTPLSGLDSPWAVRMRDWLEGEHARAVTELAELHVRCGRTDEAITMLHAALAARPAIESLAAGLIRAQAAAGWHAEAMRTYATTRQVIVAELGVEPGQQLRELHTMLLHRPTAHDLPQARTSRTPCGHAPGRPRPSYPTS